MKNRTPIAEVTDALAENARLLADANQDLEGMPRFKTGSIFHTDRVRAKQRLLRRRDELHNEHRQLTATS